MAKSVFSFNFNHGAMLIHVLSFFNCRMLAETEDLYIGKRNTSQQPMKSPTAIFNAKETGTVPETQ